MGTLFEMLALLNAATLSANEIKWCARNSMEFQKCRDISHIFESASRTHITCIEILSERGCIEAVRLEPRTITTLSAPELYHIPTRDQELKVILSEDYASNRELVYGSGISYYSVAVVKAGYPDLKIRDLKGRRVCHGQYDPDGRSGWDIPISYLEYYDGTKRFHLEDRCNLIETVDEFFGWSCLPDPAGHVPRMDTCKMCSSGSCPQEQHYLGYDGALRCLSEGAGEVAFLRHDTVAQLTDGVSDKPWTKGLLSREYRLLCRDNTQTTVDNYRSCYIGFMKPNVLVLNGNATDEQVKQTQRDLINPPPRAAEIFFDSSKYSVTSKDLLFSGDTNELLPVYGDKQIPSNYLGNEGGYWYRAAMDQIYCKNTASLPSISLLLYVCCYGIVVWCSL